MNKSNTRFPAETLVAHTQHRRTGDHTAGTWNTETDSRFSGDEATTQLLNQCCRLITFFTASWDEFFSIRYKFTAYYGCTKFQKFQC